MNLVSIPEEIDRLYTKSDWTGTKQKLGNAKKTLEDIKSAREMIIQRLKTELHAEIKNVKAFRQELQALLETMEQATIQELQKDFNRIITSLAVYIDITNVETQLSCFDDAAHQLQKAEGNKADEFVCVKSYQKLLAQGDEIQKNLPMAADETVCFKRDQSIKAFLLQKKTFGKVSAEKSEGSISKAKELKFIPKNGLYKVKQQKQLDVKLETDREICYTWGSCIADDGFLLLADNWNKRLKCVDMSTGTVKNYIDLRFPPWAVCTTSKNEAAVTLDNKSVQFVSLGEKMKATRTLAMNHECCGLAYKDGKLFTSDNKKSVHIYDMNGQKLKKIAKDTTNTNIFQRANHIAVNANGEMVFVPDFNNGVIVLDSQGNYLGSWDKTTESVCTDGTNVFSYSNVSNNIVQLGHDFQALGKIGMVVGPASLCFDHKKKRLIATIHRKYEITIFELE